MNLTLWLSVAAAQTVALGVAAWVIWKGEKRLLLLGGILLGIGALILGVNLLWLATGGSEGSPIGMRGGMAGFWLSSVLALEIMTVGVLALVSAPRNT